MALERLRVPPTSTMLIECSENLGFGKACNLGLEHVSEPVTALTNPDVELLDDSLARLALEVGCRDRPERLLAPLVLNADGTRQDTVHPIPSSFPDLIHALLPPALVPGTLLAPWRAIAPRRVGWAVGCALVARTETLRKLGPFDEQIFLYGEDLDLALRGRQHGVETWFWPHARVLHRRAHSTFTAFGGEPFDALAAARHDVVRGRLGPGRGRLDDFSQAVTFASRLLVKRVLGRSAERERRQLAALRRVA